MTVYGPKCGLKQSSGTCQIEHADHLFEWTGYTGLKWHSTRGGKGHEPGKPTGVWGPAWGFPSLQPQGIKQNTLLCFLRMRSACMRLKAVTGVRTSVIFNFLQSHWRTTKSSTEKISSANRSLLPSVRYLTHWLVTPAELS